MMTDILKAYGQFTYGNNEPTMLYVSPPMWESLREALYPKGEIPVSERPNSFRFQNADVFPLQLHNDRYILVFNEVYPGHSKYNGIYSFGGWGDISEVMFGGA